MAGSRCPPESSAWHEQLRADDEQRESIALTQFFLFYVFGVPLLIAAGIVVACIKVERPFIAKLVAGCFFGAGAFIAIAGGLWMLSWVVSAAQSL